MSSAPYHLDRRPPRAPAWVLGDPAEYLANREEDRYRTAPESLRFEQTSSGDQILEGIAVPYLQWATIRSPSEGHFLERFMPGSLADEVPSDTRVLFEHGDDATIGRQQIAVVDSLRSLVDGLHYRARLLQGVPELIVSGLRAGVYGSSVRFAPLESETNRFPRRSEENPTQLPEKSIVRARLREFSVVTFPAYAGAIAAVRGDH